MAFGAAVAGNSSGTRFLEDPSRDSVFLFESLQSSTSMCERLPPKSLPHRLAYLREREAKHDQKLSL
ncbi:hypothetical protein TNCV_1706071 [Trichonephila clavipes]|nr:hypothetical protein TNCV_1706071 [Trichonephila clavipes]